MSDKPVENLHEMDRDQLLHFAQMSKANNQYQQDRIQELEKQLAEANESLVGYEQRIRDLEHNITEIMEGGVSNGMPMLRRRSTKSS